MNHFPIGAIIKNSNPETYKTPYEAVKGVEYICPDCNRDLILKKGEINRHHFAHKSSNDPCTYYTNPTKTQEESQIHRAAKHIISSRVNKGDLLTISRACNNSRCSNRKLEHISNAKAIEEYSFLHNNSRKRADIAILKDDKMVYVVEVYYSHCTQEQNRPEPWCEVNASETYTRLQINTFGKEFSINCIRKTYECNSCINEREKKEAAEKERKEKEAKQRIIYEARMRILEAAEKEKREKEAEQRRILEVAEKEKREKEAEEKRNKYIIDSVKYYDEDYEDGFITEEERKKKKFLAVRQEECKQILYDIMKKNKKCGSCKLDRCKKCRTKNLRERDKEIDKRISEWKEIIYEVLPVQKENT